MGEGRGDGHSFYSWFLQESGKPANQEQQISEFKLKS